MGYYLGMKTRGGCLGHFHTHVQTVMSASIPRHWLHHGYRHDRPDCIRVLGVRVEQSIAMFRGDLTEYFKTAEGDLRAVAGALFDTRKRKMHSVTRVWERWNVR